MSTFLRGLAFVVLAAILILLLGPATAIENAAPSLDKVAHFGAFGLALWSFGVLFPRSRRISLAGMVVVMGGATEVAQGLVGRDADWLDFAADVAGVAVALVAWTVWRGFEPRRARTTVVSSALHAP
jgi:VanZ family protein